MENRINEDELNKILDRREDRDGKYLTITFFSLLIVYGVLHKLFGFTLS